MEQAIQSYKRYTFNRNFDVIVIGSGISGLALAAILSKSGKRVLVLERHYTAGGYTHVFKRRGYEWDVGIHYIGEVHRQDSALSQWFNYISDNALKWAPMGEVYDKIIFGDDVYPFHTGRENFISHLQAQFPAKKDQKAIEAYVQLIYDAQRSTQLYFAEKALPKAVSWLAGGQMRKKMLRYSRKSTLEVLQSISDNPKLIAVLVGQYGDYGLPPSQSSFAIHAMVAKHYMNGASFPIGGSSTIAKSVAAVIAKGGGVVLTNAEVAQVVVKNHKASGVQMTDGRYIEAPIVVSSTGVYNTYNKLLSPELREKHQLAKKLDSVEPSVAHVCLYIGLQHSVQDLGLEKPNLWIYPDGAYDHDANVAAYLANPNTDFPVVYISFPSVKDPDWNNRYPNRATIDIITLAPYKWFAKWQGSKWKKREKAYDAFKEQLSQRLLEVLYRYVPQVKGKVDHYELSTPLTTQHFCNYEQGEIYGLNHNPNRFEQKHLRPRTPIKNLYLTGQDIVSCGIGGALAAGVITASAMLKRDVSGMIRKAVK